MKQSDKEFGKWSKRHVPVGVWVAPCRGGVKFWERSRWKAYNPDGDLEDGYTELSSLLTDLCENTILYDGYPIRDSFIVGMHDELGDKYTEYVTYYGDGDYFTSESDWQEAQDEMYLDWVVPLEFGMSDDIWFGAVEETIARNPFKYSDYEEE